MWLLLVAGSKSARSSKQGMLDRQFSMFVLLFLFYYCKYGKTENLYTFFLFFLWLYVASKQQPFVHKQISPAFQAS